MNQSNISLRSTLAKTSLTEDVPKAHAVQQQAYTERGQANTRRRDLALCSLASFNQLSCEQVCFCFFIFVV